MKSLSRKTRSDKFPLTLHPTGQYCKKIRGHIYYFGSDRKQALENYLDQAIFLHGYNNAMQKSINGNMTLKEICDMYLKYQNTKLQANNLTTRQRLLGHVNLTMATRYVQDVSAQTDKVIENSRNYVVCEKY
jgi:hypothetical protein